ncbi:putative P450 monooxygenase [Myriangium duriaei CBS 260.36]|uniref:P450 monooxygenase n=1 Tax=Myriangium duriaei CBS 260.36 TaxID=1168546 RepID=A0A9P4ITJ5_9PEZI|nr:putative P450 monooxygenase [Myriangium duriaei CBS 260.36]
MGLLPSLSSASPVFAGSLILAIVYYVYFQLTTGARRRAIIREKGCLPVNKVPSKDPILGIDSFLEFRKAFQERRVLQFACWRFDMMGVTTIRNNVLGKRNISTIEPENLKQILALDFKNWSLGTQRIIDFTEFLGPGVFSTDGAEWQHSREMLRPSFVRSQVRDLETLDAHVDHLIDAIPRDGSTVELQQLFFRLTMDSATDFLFGESTNTLAPGLATVSASKFAECFNRGQETVSERGRFGLFPWLANNDHFKSDTKFVHDFVDTYVEKGLAMRSRLLSEKEGAGSRYVFLEELVRQTTDKYRIRSELLNILLAGRDTTASLLSNVWWQISRRPDIWAKLRAEVDALNGEKPTFEQIKEMKYVRAVLNESLRLHPVVPFNSREATTDTWLPRGGGKDGMSPCLIPKGQVVTYSVYVMHRRKDFYGPDADEFNPDRWIGEKGLRPGWEYLPFNGGPRICLGQQFALTEASYATIRLLQEFRDIESRDPEPWTEWLHLTCVGRNGCKVSLTPFSNA